MNLNAAIILYSPLVQNDLYFAGEDPDCEWRTINGHHVCIREGETAKQAFARTLKDIKNKGETVASGHGAQERKFVGSWVTTNASKSSKVQKAALELKQNKGASLSLSKNTQNAKLDSRLARTMQKVYDQTQAYYKANGIKSLTLYRGVKADIKQRSPLESWTKDPDATAVFTGRKDSGNNVRWTGAIEKATIPVSAVLMSYDSHMDVWKRMAEGEQEVVVIGGGLKGIKVGENYSPKSFLKEIGKESKSNAKSDPDYKVWKDLTNKQENFHKPLAAKKEKDVFGPEHTAWLKQFRSIANQVETVENRLTRKYGGGWLR